MYYEDLYELWGVPRKLERKKKRKKYILQLADGCYVMDEDSENNGILEIHDKSFACTFGTIEEAESYSREHWIDARVVEHN